LNGTSDRSWAYVLENPERGFVSVAKLATDQFTLDRGPESARGC
jgi:hypothetical protein